jgi:hypothetical protein
MSWVQHAGGAPAALAVDGASVVKEWPVDITYLFPFLALLCVCEDTCSWVASPVSRILLYLILRRAVMTAQLRYLASHILPRLYVCSSHRASLCSSPLVLGLR